MPIKVYKVADIIDGEAVFSGKRFRESDLAAVLTTFLPSSARSSISGDVEMYDSITDNNRLY